MRVGLGRPAPGALALATLAGGLAFLVAALLLGAALGGGVGSLTGSTSANAAALYVAIFLGAVVGGAVGGWRATRSGSPTPGATLATALAGPVLLTLLVAAIRSGSARAIAGNLLEVAAGAALGSVWLARRRPVSG